MSYTPHTWSTGETITAAKLNALENGVAEGGGGAGTLRVVFTYDEPNDSWSASETLSDLIDAYIGGSLVYGVEESLDGASLDYASIFQLQLIEQGSARFTSVGVDPDSILSTVTFLLDPYDAVTMTSAAYDLSSLID